jgi:hypothetical protein
VVWDESQEQVVGLAGKKRRPGGSGPSARRRGGVHRLESHRESSLVCGMGDGREIVLGLRCGGISQGLTGRAGQHPAGDRVHRGVRRPSSRGRQGVAASVQQVSMAWPASQASLQYSSILTPSPSDWQSMISMVA